MTDVGRLYSAQVKEVVHVREIADLQAAVQRAGAEKLKVSISAKRHSQGGHVFYKDAVVLDMARFNKILRLDKERKIITVQSGVTWEDIQNYANNHGLAVRAQQASNIFTVSGSVSNSIRWVSEDFGCSQSMRRYVRKPLARRVGYGDQKENKAFWRCGNWHMANAGKKKGEEASQPEAEPIGYRYSSSSRKAWDP